MSDVDAAEEWLDSWVSQVNAQAERSVELTRRVAGLTGTATGWNGAIRVTVGSAGQIEQLHLDDSALDYDGAQLAREILAVMRRAQSELTAKVTEQVRETVGADSETGRAVIHSFDARFPAVESRDD